MGILSEKSPGSALFWVRVVISLSLYGYELWICISRKDFTSSDVLILSAKAQSLHCFGQSCYITVLELIIPSQQQISSKSHNFRTSCDWGSSFLCLHLLLLIHRLQKGIEIHCRVIQKDQKLADHHKWKFLGTSNRLKNQLQASAVSVTAPILPITLHICGHCNSYEGNSYLRSKLWEGNSENSYLIVIHSINSTITTLLVHPVKLKSFTNNICKEKLNKKRNP